MILKQQILIAKPKTTNTPNNQNNTFLASKTSRSNL